MWLLHYYKEEHDRAQEYIVLVPEENKPDPEEWDEFGYTLENCIEIEMADFNRFPNSLPVNVTLNKAY